ncbi:hypothetical protein C3V43_00915 [Bacteroides heparinolyticus]|nr:hypothetical protein C3V43_00915 [Bacteroides heparinolyticus]
MLKGTANHDIQNLAQKDILREDIPEAKHPAYSICCRAKDSGIANLFSDICIVEENKEFSDFPCLYTSN